MSADPAEAGCVACDDDGGGGVDVGKRSVHCAVVGWTLSADHCRWSTGSPAKSSYHSPGPLDRRHPLEETDRQTRNTSLTGFQEKLKDCCEVDERSRFQNC